MTLKERIISYLQKREGMTIVALRGLCERCKEKYDPHAVETEVAKLVREGKLGLTNGVLWLPKTPRVHPRQMSFGDPK